MLGSWCAKGFLAFLLTFALAGLARGQTKSADLPVPQRVNCAPAYALTTDHPATSDAFWNLSGLLMPDVKRQPYDLVQLLVGRNGTVASDTGSSDLLIAQLAWLPLFLADPFAFWNLLR